MEWLTWVIQTAILLVVSIVGFLLKQTLASLRCDIDKNAQRIDDLEEKLNNTIAQLPYNYTLRDDFIRAVAGIERKLDKIIDSLSGKQ